MTETLLVLPLYLFVLSMILFFGQAFVRRQQVQLTSHYSVWRAFHGNLPSEGYLESNVLNNASAEMGLSIEEPSAGHAEYWIDQVERLGREAGTLAREIIREARSTELHYEGNSYWRRNGLIRAWAAYPHSIRGMQFLDTRYDSDESREGLEWARREASNEGKLRELYYQDLDDALESIDTEEDDSLPRRIRNLYRYAW